MQRLLQLHHSHVVAALVLLMGLNGCASAGTGSADEPMTEVPTAGPCTVQPGGPCFMQLVRRPVIANQENVLRMMQRMYPEDLRRKKIGGTTLLWLFVDEQGRVQKVELKKSSGNPDLDRIARTIGYRMRFEPARDDDGPVKVWVQMPVQFSTSIVEKPERLRQVEVLALSLRRR